MKMYFELNSDPLCGCQLEAESVEHFLLRYQKYEKSDVAHDEVWLMSKKQDKWPPNSTEILLLAVLHNNNGCIRTKLSLSLTSPTLCPFGFLPHSNPQMAVSLRCEFYHSSHGETVCQTVCYTVQSHVLSLHALTLRSTIILLPV